jgi:electron transfer flavoprotein alpha subunit
MKLNHVLVVATEVKAVAELCAGGRMIGEKVTAVVFGEEATGNSAISYGADQVYLCPDADHAVMPESYARAIADLAKEQDANLILLASSVRSRLMAGKMAVYLDSCVVAGISAIEIKDAPVTTRMVYGGAVIQTEKLTGKIPVATIGFGVFPIPDADTTRKGSITALHTTIEKGINRLESHEKKEAVVNLATARCIVDMGRGFSKKEDLELGNKVASLLGADVGCSRPVAESNGWMPRARYIGVTGVVIKPDLCLSLGVSGQVQHLVGINQSKTVVAINKDKNAPIFKHADFGVVGDMYKILPALIAKLS